VRNLPSLKPPTIPPPSFEDITVSHLIHSDSLSWVHAIVCSLFNHTDATAVLATPLCPRLIEDTRVWKATVDGSYTVKFAYRLCMDLIHVQEPPHNSQRNLLWNLKVPPLFFGE